MLRKHLFIVWLPMLFLVLEHYHVAAWQNIDCCKNKGQTQLAIAKLNDGDFIRVRAASKREVKGYFRVFDGSRLVIEDKGNLVTIDVKDVVVIKRGRGFWGSLQKGFSRAGRIVATPVTEIIIAYQLAQYFNEWP